MTQRPWIATFLLLAAPLAATAQDTLPAGQQPARPQVNEAQLAQMVSYALGRSIASDVARAGMQLDMQALNAGIQDAASGAESRFSDQQLNATMQHFAQRIQQRIAMENKQQGEAFLAENAKKEGVQTTDSGLQYKVLREGDGASPTANDNVICHYRGTLISGEEFDSSYGGQPAQFPVSGVIAGWTEALQLMQVGDKYQLFVPSQLAYGERGAGGAIGPNETLIFEVELLGIGQ